jgi:hypothetical protein
VSHETEKKKARETDLTGFALAETESDKNDIY